MIFMAASKKSRQPKTSDAVRVTLLEGELRHMKAKVAGLKADLLAAAEANARARRVSVVPHVRRARRARLKGDKVRVIVQDNHGSVGNRLAIAALLADVAALNPHEIIHLGDGVNCGGFLAQHHVLGYVAETEYSYEQDLADAGAFLDGLQAAAPRLEAFEYIEGNHERRVETWCVTETLRHRRDAEFLRRQFTPEHQLRLKERGIRYYRQSEFYDDLPVPGTIKRGKCFFWHGTSSAKDTTSRNLVQVAGNVVFGHVHRAQTRVIRPVATGEIGAWCAGCLCELVPLWQHTRPTDWTHGYGLQLVAPSGNFLHLNIPIVAGESLLAPLLSKS